MPPADAVIWNHFCGFGFRFHEQGIEAFLAERNEFGGIRVKFVPHFPIQDTGTSKAFDTAKSQRGIKRCQITELHCHRTWGAPNAFGQIYDHRLPLIKLTEAELMIEIEDDEKLIPRPAFAGSHTPSMLLLNGSCE